MVRLKREVQHFLKPQAGVDYSRELDDERKSAADEMKGNAWGVRGSLTVGPTELSWGLLLWLRGGFGELGGVREAHTRWSIWYSSCCRSQYSSLLNNVNLWTLWVYSVSRKQYRTLQTICKCKELHIHIAQHCFFPGCRVNHSKPKYQCSSTHLRSRVDTTAISTSSFWTFALRSENKITLIICVNAILLVSLASDDGQVLGQGSLQASQVTRDQNGKTIIDLTICTGAFSCSNSKGSSPNCCKAGKDTIV